MNAAEITAANAALAQWQGQGTKHKDVDVTFKEANGQDAIAHVGPDGQAHVFPLDAQHSAKHLKKMIAAAEAALPKLIEAAQKSPGQDQVARMTVDGQSIAAMVHRDAATGQTSFDYGQVQDGNVGPAATVKLHTHHGGGFLGFLSGVAHTVATVAGMIPGLQPVAAAAGVVGSVANVIQGQSPVTSLASAIPGVAPIMNKVTTGVNAVQQLANGQVLQGIETTANAVAQVAPGAAGVAGTVGQIASAVQQTSSWLGNSAAFIQAFNPAAAAPAQPTAATQPVAATAPAAAQNLTTAQTQQQITQSSQSSDAAQLQALQTYRQTRANLIGTPVAGTVPLMTPAQAAANVADIYNSARQSF